MNLSHEEENNYDLSLSKFESMLKTNKVLFFDSEEFEEIILHYMDTGRLNLAKKAYSTAYPLLFQAPIPPLRLYTFLKPKALIFCIAFELRPPAAQ